jgi:hypothetical protein
MNRGRFSHLLAPLGVVVGFSFSACGGESEKKVDDSGGEAGEPSNGGSSSGSGGTTSTGGTSTGGTGGMIDGVCEDIMPCGGDPEGTWEVRENCAEVLVPISDFAMTPGCEDVIGRGSGEIEGTFTFADGMMTQDIVVTTTVSVTITDSCAQGLFGSPDITAALLCPVLDSMFMNDMNVMGSCAATNAGCQCDGMQAPMPNMNTGAYTIMGNQLVGANGQIFDFCQDGDELHLHGNTVDDQTGQVVALTLLLDRI